MGSSLWFVVPVHGRHKLAQICLRQLRRTCDALTESGVEASAVIVGDEPFFNKLADQLGFAWRERDNQFVSDKFNDGIQLALDERYNPRPADYIVPLGSDDWVDHRLFLELPDEHTMFGFQRMSFVREDGQEIAAMNLKVQGGCGVRIYPRNLMQRLMYRPADPDRYRACDTSILVNLQLLWGDQMRIEHRHLHDRQIVDWKTPGRQLNPYETILRRHHGTRMLNPFRELAGIYPAEALAEMKRHYTAQEGLVAA